MRRENDFPPKPINEKVRPEITRLPPLTFWRRAARGLWRAAVKLLTWLFTETQVSGLENVPAQGGALIVANHLGDADFVLGIAFAPRPPDPLAKAELYDYPLLGRLLEYYGVIWVHRGQPDRRALRAALRGLAEGRLISIAPEGRESLMGALEEGTHGAAWLALKADAPILPVTFTGTENQLVFSNMKRLRRTAVTLTIGPLFKLEPLEDRHMAIQRGTEAIMRTLANQLPPEYRGFYQTDPENQHDS